MLSDIEPSSVGRAPALRPGASTGRGSFESTKGASQREGMRPEGCESPTGNSTCASALATRPHFSSLGRRTNEAHGNPPPRAHQER